MQIIYEDHAEVDQNVIRRKSVVLTYYTWPKWNTEVQTSYRTKLGIHFNAGQGADVVTYVYWHVIIYAMYAIVSCKKQVWICAWSCCEGRQTYIQVDTRKTNSVRFFLFQFGWNIESNSTIAEYWWNTTCTIASIPYICIWAGIYKITGDFYCLYAK